MKNAKRQELCERIFAEADQMVSSRADLINDKAIAIYKSGWHHGVVGIVASRLVEKYGRPVFIAELDEVEGIIKGSARSIDTIDLYAVLKTNESLLSKWGGHKMAAGFSTASTKAEILCRALIDTINRTLGDKPLSSNLAIDVVAEAKAVDLELAKTFFKLAPFGMSNKKPLLYLNNLSCENTRILGKEGKHHRLNLIDKESKTQFECVMWSSQGRIPADGELIDIVFIPEVNAYNGRERLQLVVSDWRLTGSELESSSLVYEVPENSLVISEDIDKSAHSAPGLEQSNRSEEPIIQVAAAALPADDVLPKVNFKDLREHNNRVETLKKAIVKFGTNVSIFAESSARPAGLTCTDRLELTPKEHLVIWQYPPSLKVFQEILIRSKATNIYLVGQTDESPESAGTFIKQLLGLVRFAINKRDGQVEAEKFVAAMATTKMALALGLNALKKINVIDWYAEGGTIFPRFNRRSYRKSRRFERVYSTD